jgi:hypothetical protein
MIKLITPALPPWKVVPQNIVKLMDTVHNVKGTSRCSATAASAVRALPCVESAYPSGVVDPQICVKFKGNWEYREAIVDLGDDFDPIPWEW